jgi:alpha-amylase
MVLMVLNNLGESAENYTVEMSDVGFEGGLQVTNVLNCRNATVDDYGGLVVEFIGGLPSVSCLNTSSNYLTVRFRSITHSIY